MTYIATTLYLNSLYQEQKDPFTKNAGIATDIATGIWNYGKSIIEDIKTDPISGILSFIGGGLLVKLGFPWIGLAYEVAGALGVDWAGFWRSIKDSVVNIFKDIFSGKKPTQEELHQKLVSETDKNIDQNMHDKVDEAKLKEISDKEQGIKSSSLDSLGLTKEAGLLSGVIGTSRGLLSRLFKKIIPWALTTFFVSAGLAIGTGALAGAAGITPGPKKDESEFNQDPMSKTREPIYDLPMSQNIDPDLTEFNKNDENSIWIESGSINNIKNILTGWILNVFPSLKNEISNISNSSSFKQVENMFRERNKMAQGLPIYSIPRPFQSKIDIVSFIVNGYLKTKGSDAPKT